MASTVAEDRLDVAQTPRPRQQVHLLQLPDIIFYRLLRFLSPAQLRGLRLVCQRTKFFAENNGLWRVRSAALTLGSGQALQESAEIGMEAWRAYVVAERWQKNRREATETVWHFPKKQMAHMQLDYVAERLWFSYENSVVCHRVLPGGSISQRPLFQRRLHSGSSPHSAISSFVVTEDHLVSVSSTGSLGVVKFGLGAASYEAEGVHTREITALDCAGELLVTASKDKRAKLLRLLPGAGVREEWTVESTDRFWSAAFQPEVATVVALGSACVETEHPLQLHDVSTGRMIHNFERSNLLGAGLLCIDWVNPNTLVAGGYEGIARMYDARSGRIVRSFYEPDDNCIYSLKTDKAYGLVIGCANYAMSRLFDIRYCRKQVATYSCKAGQTAVNSLDFSLEYLYMALARGIVLHRFAEPL